MGAPAPSSPASELRALRSRIERCRLCPRLVSWREKLASEGRARTGEEHWGRPIAGFGDPEARLLLVGLAPAARGANRTGRVFTGDRSAEFLVAALYRSGLANQPTSTGTQDGLELKGAFMTAAVRCVPPDNRPTPEEFERCRPWLLREMRSLPKLEVVLALGGGAWEQVRKIAPELYGRPRPRLSFRHGLRVDLGAGAPILWACYHPSPRNVQTGLFTVEMMDRLLEGVRSDLGGVAAKG